MGLFTEPDIPYETIDERALLYAYMLLRNDVLNNTGVMMSKKLKPCPFCGSDAKLFPHTHIENNSNNGGEYAIVCQNAEAICNVRLLYCRTKEEAIKQWNTRPELQESVYKKAWERLKILIKNAMEYSEPLLDCMDYIEKELSDISRGY